MIMVCDKIRATVGMQRQTCMVVHFKSDKSSAKFFNDTINKCSALSSFVMQKNVCL